MSTATATKPASDKQVNLIRTLCDERGLDVDATVSARFGADISIDILTGGRDGQASDLITFLFASKPAREGTTKVDPEPGLYRVGTGFDKDDFIVRIKLSKSGNWYAQTAIKRPGRTTFVWEYLGKRINMAGAIRYTDEEAGKFLGYCVRCNAELTDPVSIARGIGPVCAKKGVA